MAIGGVDGTGKFFGSGDGEKKLKTEQQEQNESLFPRGLLKAAVDVEDLWVQKQNIFGLRKKHSDRETKDVGNTNAEDKAFAKANADKTRIMAETKAIENQIEKRAEINPEIADHVFLEDKKIKSYGEKFSS